MKWYQHLYMTPQEPDRVERLLTSARAYYRAGDHDIVALLLKEIEKALVIPPGNVFGPRK